jgi:hypothetical protein
MFMGGFMSDKPETLDTVERIVKLMRELVLLGLVAYLGWYLVPCVPKWTAQLDNAQISEVSIPGLGFKIAVAEQKLEQAAKTQTPQKSANDDGLTPDKKLIVEALESVRSVNLQVTAELAPNATVAPTVRQGGAPTPVPSDATFWVYLGVAKGDAIPSKNFRISKLPTTGDIIVASAEVFKRSSAPIYKDGDGWFLGDAVGIVRSGQRVIVRRLEKVNST